MVVELTDDLNFMLAVGKTMSFNKWKLYIMKLRSVLLTTTAPLRDG